MAHVVLLDYKFRPEKRSKPRPRKYINGLQSRNSAIQNTEGYILPYWKELSAQQLLSMFIKKKDIFNKQKSLKVITNVVNWRFTSQHRVLEMTHSLYANPYFCFVFCFLFFVFFGFFFRFWTIFI